MVSPDPRQCPRLGGQAKIDPYCQTMISTTSCSDEGNVRRVIVGGATLLVDPRGVVDAADFFVDGAGEPKSGLPKQRCGARRVTMRAYASLLQIPLSTP